MEAQQEPSITIQHVIGMKELDIIALKMRADEMQKTITEQQQVIDGLREIIGATETEEVEAKPELISTNGKKKN